MSSMFDLGTIVHLLLTLLWVVVLLATAGMALLRFRTSASGLLLGVALAAMALQRLAVFLSGTIVPPMLDDPSMYLTAQASLVHLLSLLELLAIGAGIALIPRSLAQRRG